MPKITKRSVDALKPAENDVYLWDAGDGALKGFGVRLKPSGVCTFFLQYRNYAGDTRRLKLGRKGELTADEARARAAAKLAEVRKGGDPSAERRTLRHAMSVSELCDLYLTEAKGRIKDTTLAADKSRIEQHVKPLLGSRSVTSLTTRDLEKFQADVAAGKSANAKRQVGRGGRTAGGRGVASRTVGMIGTILEFAKRQGLIQLNPARGVRRFSDQKRTRFLSSEEMAKLGSAMREAIAQAESPTGISAIRALLLTGCRRNEMLSLPPGWLDVRASCIRFGDTKSGAQLRPVGKPAVELLDTLAQETTTGWVFPAERGTGHFVGLPKVLRRLCARAGLADVTIHTLRHTFAAVAAELGFSELTIAGLLGHKLPGVTARYAHMPDSALVIAADRVASRIAATLDGLVEAKVVSLDKRRAAG